ncbi:hypothetical protein DSCA_48190 [Desulfosarcina alkanivorans]|uniref:DUF560 domain-containing protein n=1 Tax=Desulfosarcina alkanivorans TaxID=571177 RepID=A0A5K7YSE9_9BACT|nr:hypothetical protein [Desulfosarcina alkanivorans]BBO70889.1 hypothetical protein DSCA_48190 [Desulfosarcina alkanivorans]
MKPLRWIMLTTLMVSMGSVAPAMDVSVQTGMNTNFWDSDSNDRGSQTYVPVTIDAAHGDFSARVLSAFVSTRIDPSDASKNSMTTAIDTKVNLSYAVLEKFPVDILFGLDLNLPTGRTDLDSEERRMLLDPDLVTISRYGEGFNVNPTITMAKQVDRWGVGIGAGYLWRGEYDFSDSAEDFNPGDIFNVTAEGIYAFTDRWQGRLFGEMAWYGTDEIDDRDYYREGDYILAGIGVDYARTRWEAALGAQRIYRGKCEFPADSQQLATEDRAGYGDEYLADLTLRYLMNTETTLSSRLYYLMVTENDYDADDPAFIDEKQKISLSLSLKHRFSARTAGRIGLEGYLLEQGRNWYVDEDRDYRGFIVDFSLTRAF